MSSRDWPLTGRTSDLARANVALRESGGVVLAGPAGVGKSRLAREVLGSSKRFGGAVRWVGATEARRDVPLGAFAPMIGGAEGPADVSLLSRVATAVRQDIAVLAVDDAHLLDDVSAALLHQLSVERAIKLVVTVRSGEQASDAVTALWKDELLGRVELAPLDEPGTTALLEAVLGDELDRPSARRLYSATQGNVLWLRHLVHGEHAAGRLAKTTGRWQWTGEPEITPALADLIDSSIGRLTNQQRLVLDLLAFGEPLGADLLATLADPSAVAEVEERRLIAVEPSGRRLEVRLAHPLYGEAVRSRTSRLGARRLRGQLAEALTTTGTRRTSDILRRAVLALDSDLPTDPRLLTEAATMASMVADWPLTERLLRAAGDAGGGYEAHLALGLMLAWIVRWDEAEAELVTATHLAETDEQLTRAMVVRALNRFFLMGQPEEAHELLAEAERAIADPTSQAATYLHGIRASFAMALNKMDETVELATPIVRRPDSPPFTVAWAGYGLVVVKALTGHADQLDELTERVVGAAAAAPATAMMRFNLRYMQIYGLGLAGYLSQARDRTSWLRDLPGPYAGMARDATNGRIALDGGQVHTAARLLRGNRPFYPGSGGGWTPIWETSIALALGMAGDAAGAREALDRADEFRHRGVLMIEPELTLARAWAKAAEGAIGSAVTLAEHAAQLAYASGQFAVEVVARHSAVCLGDVGQAERLTQLAELVDGPRAPAAAAHARALASGDPEALLAASGRLERHELLLPAADAAAQAAALLRTRGCSARSAFAGARAAALAERCEGARTPALTAGTSPLPISAREREVATMAATGLSNRQIAAELHVSVRTVEGHIYRACTRLGLTDRAALASLLTDPDRAQPPP